MKKNALLIFAGIGIIIATIAVIAENRSSPTVTTNGYFAQIPFATYIAGNGIIEASTQNIAVGTPISGIVLAIYVKPGDPCRVGDPLFKIDDRDLQSALGIAKAKVQENAARLEQDQKSLEFAEKVQDKRAISAEELNQRRFAVKIDEAVLAGSQAQVVQIMTDIDRTTVHALIAGRIFQINIRPGEFAATGNTTPPLMVIGDDAEPHVRVNIDENDAWRFHSGAPAVAYVRGNPNLKISLQFVRVEPYVIPKTSYTNSSTERMDTRVLQLIYCSNNPEIPLYVGQQLDVFIQTPPQKNIRKQ